MCLYDSWMSLIMLILPQKSRGARMQEGTLMIKKQISHVLNGFQLVLVLMLLFSFQGERQWERVVANLPMVYYVNST